MRQIIEWSIQARVLVIALAVGLVVFGSTQAREAPVDTLPEFQQTTVMIHAEALGLSSQEVEQLVTVPLEQDLLAFVPWVDVIRSESIPGLASLEVVFEPGTDLYQARQMVQERLSEAAVALPGASKVPQMLQPLSSTNRVMMVGLTSNSEDLSLIDMSVLTRWTIKPRLLGVEGVSNVAVWGNREQQLQVQIDPERMEEHGVSIDQVISTTGNALWWSPLGFVEASVPGTGGFIDTANQRLTVQHILPITSPEELAEVPIEGSPELHLDDVADVVEGHQPLIGDAVINDGPSLLLVIEKLPGANTLDVTKAVEEELEAMGPGLSGIEFDTSIYRPATSIESGIDDLTIAVIIGLVLLLILFSAFFFNWRTALISSIAVPLSLITAAVVLYVAGSGFNVMVLAGLVIAAAIVVDDALIDVDNIRRRLRERREAGDSASVAGTISNALVEMRGAAMLAALIIALSIVPVLFLNGPSGEFFPPMVLSYIVAVAAAMVVSLTVTPALAVFLLSNGDVSGREPAFISNLKSRYGQLLKRTLETPGLPLLAFAIVVLVGAAAATQLSQPSLLPDFKQRDILINWEAAPGTSQPEMTRIVSAAAAELESLDGVRNVGSHVGRAITSDQVVGASSGEIWVSISEGADYDSTRNGIQAVVDGYPGFATEIVTYPEERVTDVLAGPERDLTVRVYGENPEVLRAEAEKLLGVVGGIDGVRDPQLDLPVLEPTIEVQVDLAKAEANGVNPGDIRRTAATMVSSLFVGALFQDQKVFEVVVWSTPETRASLTDIQELPIEKPDGSLVELQEVADIRIEGNPSVIRREAISRYLDITADISGRSHGAVADDLKPLLRQAEMPLEYHAEVLEGNNGLKGQDNQGVPFAIAAGIGIFLLLQLGLASWRLAALFMVSVPAALAGGVVAALIFQGGDLSIGSYAGFFALIALVARNTLVLARRYQSLQERGVESHDAVLTGAQERIIPMLVTVSATALAFLTLIVTGDVFGHEILTPMATVILGGLVTSSLYTLFIVPTLYMRFAPSSEPVTSPPVVDMSRVQADPSMGGE
jgi:CzcA family heavy metal efflux pump